MIFPSFQGLSGSGTHLFIRSFSSDASPCIQKILVYYIARLKSANETSELEEARLKSDYQYRSYTKCSAYKDTWVKSFFVCKLLIL